MTDHYHSEFVVPLIEQAEKEYVIWADRSEGPVRKLFNKVLKQLDVTVVEPIQSTSGRMSGYVIMTSLSPNELKQAVMDLSQFFKYNPPTVVSREAASREPKKRAPFLTELPDGTTVVTGHPDIRIIGLEGFRMDKVVGGVSGRAPRSFKNYGIYYRDKRINAKSYKDMQTKVKEIIRSKRGG